MNVLGLDTPSGPVSIGIVAAQFNRFITDQMLEGCLDGLKRHDVADDAISLAWVPGAFELPLAAECMLASGSVDAVIALGAVIRGGTPHFDYVAGECARGLVDVSLKYGQPVLFGVLTTDTVEQALERASVDQANKGFDMAVAALNMISLCQRLPGSGNSDVG